MIKMFKRICLTLVAASALAATASAIESTERELAASPGGRLEVELEAGGDLTITGWDRDQVQVVVKASGRDKDNVRLEVEPTPKGVRVATELIQHRRNHHASISFDIKVPRRYDLDIETTGGDLSIYEVEGKIEGETMGGDLDLRGLRGELELSTMGGEISLSDSEVDGNVSTMGGDVELRDVVGDVDASTMGGDVRYDNVQRRRGAEGKVVKIRTMGGRIDVPDAPGGADLHTMGGEIRVDSAGKFVKAETMGGAIFIGEVDGWIEAETMGGDVEVTMIGDPSQGRRDVTLKSMGGDIHLTVPAGLSMKFDVEIEVTRRAKREYSIESDFPLEVEDSEKGRDRTLEGTGTVGSGEHRIRIRTIDGDVRIRRGR